MRRCPQWSRRSAASGLLRGSSARRWPPGVVPPPEDSSSAVEPPSDTPSSGPTLVPSSGRSNGGSLPSSGDPTGATVNHSRLKARAPKGRSGASCPRVEPAPGGSASGLPLPPTTQPDSASARTANVLQQRERTRGSTWEIIGFPPKENPPNPISVKRKYLKAGESGPSAPWLGGTVPRGDTEGNLAAGTAQIPRRATGRSAYVGGHAKPGLRCRPVGCRMA